MMPKDYEPNLGDQVSLQARHKNSNEGTVERSLGDTQTFGGGVSGKANRSLGDSQTLGGAVSPDDVTEDTVEVVDLSARYKIEKTLGKGGMGEVLLATDTRLDRKVAIKRILGDAARSRTAVHRFLAEAKAIAALNHPDIVQIYDYGRDKDGPFLVMEYVDGGSLLERCRTGALPVEEAIELACQLCDGLGRAHSKGIIHRDIKPANILLTKDGIPKLTDFGLAKAESADTGMTMAGALLGTLDFMPPEQRHDVSLVDARSDLWSLAATLYQMVTGKSPKIIKFNDIPKGLQAVLGKALEDIKEDRYQSASEFKEALRQSLRQEVIDISSLENGICPHCGSRNELNRKYCKKCAQSLEANCLSCTAKVLLWDDICGNCGQKQSVLLEQRRQLMTERCNEARVSLENFDFNAAKQIAEELESETDIRLQHLKDWCKQLNNEIYTSSREQLQRTSERVKECLKHEAAFDFPAAIHALEQIPDALRSSTLEQLQGIRICELLESVRKKHQDSQRLERLIRSRVASKQLNGLQEVVDEFLQLHPNHQGISRIKQQLIDRESKLVSVRDEAFKSASGLFNSFDYEGVLKELARIDPYYSLADIESLREKALFAKEKLRVLKQSITQALERKQYQGLFESVDEYLKLKPDEPRIQSLRLQILSREERQNQQAQEILARAQELINGCQFESAKVELNRIPEEFQNSEVVFHLQNCEENVIQRQLAMTALANGLKNRSFAKALFDVQSYWNKLAENGWIDTEFHAQYKACQNGFNNERVLKLRADRNRKILKQVLIATTVIGLIAAMGGVGFLAHSFYRSSTIAKALEAKNWDEVLEVDPRNTIALLGRAVQRLNQSTPDITGAFEDLGKAEVSNPEKPELIAAKILAYSKRATGLAESGNVLGAEADVSELSKLNASDEVLAPIVALIDLKHAISSAKSGNMLEAKQFVLRLLAAKATISIPESVLVAIAGDSLARFERSLSEQDLEEARADVAMVDKYGEKSSITESIKQRLAKAMVNRFRRFGSSNDLDFASFVSCYTEIAGLSSVEAETIVADTIPKLTAHQIVQLPPIQNSLGVQLKLITPGKFMMGSTAGDEYDGPPHEVTLTKPFYIGVFEVTQSQYETVMGENPSTFKGPENPVEMVSWFDAKEFCRRLSELPSEKDAGRIYQLPTEAEWEYVCRAGTTADYFFVDEIKAIDYAWLNLNSGKTFDKAAKMRFGDDWERFNKYLSEEKDCKTHPVGQKKPNPWGIYDIVGNVYEWCADSSGIYKAGSFIDPINSERNIWDMRVIRGGSWSVGANHATSAFRNRIDEKARHNFIGFRVVAVSAQLHGKTPVK